MAYLSSQFHGDEVGRDTLNGNCLYVSNDYGNSNNDYFNVADPFSLEYANLNDEQSDLYCSTYNTIATVFVAYFGCMPYHIVHKWYLINDYYCLCKNMYYIFYLPNEPSEWDEGFLIIDKEKPIFRFPAYMVWDYAVSIRTGEFVAVDIGISETKTIQIINTYSKKGLYIPKRARLGEREAKKIYAQYIADQNETVTIKQ